MEIDQGVDIEDYFSGTLPSVSRVTDVNESVEEIQVRENVPVSCTDFKFLLTRSG